MAGGGEAPPLVGSAFLNSWGKRGADEFYGVVKASMPMGNANSLAPETYQQILAFIFQANGATPGPTPFAGDSKQKIISFATGKTPAGGVGKAGSSISLMKPCASGVQGPFAPGEAFCSARMASG